MLEYNHKTKEFTYGPTDIHYPVYAIYMPLTKDGQGPASEDETWLKTWEVWDQVFQTIAKCTSKEDAEFIAALINKDYLFNKEKENDG